ncbi:pentapeptide repeat-containing protein [Streptomyces niveus]
MSPTPSPIPPSSDRCGHGAGPADPVGCHGVSVGRRAACLAHLSETDLTVYLNTLSPGADLDHRSTSFTPDLLARLLDALREPGGSPRLGRALFGGAMFTSDARFDTVTFTGDALFPGATFTGVAWFDNATFASDALFAGVTFAGDARFDTVTFAGGARFDTATFTGGAWFDDATFAGDARFRTVTFTGGARFAGATFTGVAWFDNATFTRNALFAGVMFTSDARFRTVTFTGVAWFGRATFTRGARFDNAMFTGDAWFVEVTFDGAPRFGPLVCEGGLVLDGAVFQQPVTVEAAARRLSCVRTRWTSTGILHLRYAELNLRDAVFEYPVLVVARPAPFRHSQSGLPLSEEGLSGEKTGVRLLSVGGVDAAHLALQDIDLSACQFAGAVHLDQMRVDGWCTFASTPSGWSRRFPWRWSRRNTLFEEHHWRVRTNRGSSQSAAFGWAVPPEGAPELKPAAVAALYRQLRKSLEDGKNEPDAADFYYGECEMRRHDTFRPVGERVLLTLYWALSGYGLRAARALGWLVAAMVVTVTVMMLWGLPADDPKPETTGRQVTAGQDLILITDTPDPRNPTGSLSDRLTTERFEKGLRVVINSVVFRSSGQDLTTAGAYAEMTSRAAEPVLLGLAVLAVRSRVKR